MPTSQLFFGNAIVQRRSPSPHYLGTRSLGSNNPNPLRSHRCLETVLLDSRGNSNSNRARVYSDSSHRLSNPPGVCSAAALARINKRASSSRQPQIFSLANPRRSNSNISKPRLWLRTRSSEGPPPSLNNRAICSVVLAQTPRIQRLPEMGCLVNPMLVSVGLERTNQPFNGSRLSPGLVPELPTQTRCSSSHLNKCESSGAPAL